MSMMNDDDDEDFEDGQPYHAKSVHSHDADTVKSVHTLRTVVAA